MVKEKQKKKRNYKPYILIAVLIIVAIIVIYIISLGQIDITAEQKNKEKINAKKQLPKLESRHEKLKALIQKKEDLNIKLNKRFKLIYFGVRLSLTLLYIGYNILLYLVFNITELGGLLRWNQVVIIIASLFTFIAFGTFANVKEFIEKIKLKLEVKTYSKYENITEQIEAHKEEETNLIASINKTGSILIDGSDLSEGKEGIA